MLVATESTANNSVFLQNNAVGDREHCQHCCLLLVATENTANNAVFLQKLCWWGQRTLPTTLSSYKIMLVATENTANNAVFSQNYAGGDIKH